MDEPPPLDALSIDNESASNNEQNVMDEMVEVAIRAKKIKQAARHAEQKKRNKAFGNGLKKGFFNQSKPPSKGNNQDENDIPTIRPKSIKEPLHIPEVHHAMNEFQKLNPQDWMTPEFFQKLAQHPNLCQALKNPRFTTAIEELSKNPSAAALKYQNDPDFGVMFKDFMAFLGNHFNELGKVEEDKPSKEEIQRHALESMSRTAEEETQVQTILNDPELQSILADPTMRDVLYACQQPGALQKYLSHEEYGPKIRKLATAGLVQLHP